MRCSFVRQVTQCLYAGISAALERVQLAGLTTAGLGSSFHSFNKDIKMPNRTPPKVFLQIIHTSNLRLVRAPCPPPRVASGVQQLLQSCNAAMLQSCKAAKLQSCKAAKLQSCNAAMLQCCKAAMLQCCNAAKLQSCNAAMLQSCKAAMLQCCNAAMLQCCNAAMLQCCNAALRRKPNARAL